MIPELGHLALILALALALLQATLPLAGAHTGHARWMALARPLATGQWLFTTLAFAALVQAFVRNDFSVSYVGEHSNSLLPLLYRIAGTWGGHEGSLLLWVEMLALWTLAVTRFSRDLPEPLVARVLGVLGLVSVGFLSFALFTSDPFARSLPPLIDGRDLNPLLQDVAMIAHPPLLYMGYVGFSVAFAFAIAALLEGRIDSAWTRWTRPWTLAAWAFLTTGIGLGSFWAYYELGWGGWWFWDPVENASFMPWLVGTALIHSLAVTEKRGSFRNWTVLLAILAFSLSLLGTFLVRSGVLTSVHAFAADPRRGLYVLVFLAIVVGGALALYAWRAPTIGLGGRFALFSRETALLLNNVLLAAAAGTVLLGTLYPLFIDALGLGKLSVGPPYFESVFVPLMLPLLLLLGIGPVLAWKQASPGDALRRLRWWALGAIGFALLAGLALQVSLLVAAGLAAAAWVILTTLVQLAQRLSQPGVAWARRLGSVPASHWGMVVAHLGIGVFVIGVALVKGTETSQDLSLKPGDSATVGAYTLRFDDAERLKGPNYVALRTRFTLQRDGATLALLAPEKRFYVVQQMPMTEAAIDRGFTRDVYVSLGETTADKRWIVRVQIKPFVGWIWAGVLLIALGGSLAAADRRYLVPPRSLRSLPPAGALAADRQSRIHAKPRPAGPSTIVTALGAMDP
jgi:cytochrome c-type biogenesis protein CcmF